MVWAALTPTVAREYKGVIDSSPLQNSGVKTLEVLTQQRPGSVCVSVHSREPTFLVRNSQVNGPQVTQQHPQEHR